MTPDVLYLAALTAAADGDPDTAAAVLAYRDDPAALAALLAEGVPRTNPRRPFADRTLAGPDGRRMAELVRGAQAASVRVLADATREAAGRALAAGGVQGSLYTDAELAKIADAVAGVSSVADLLGRARVRNLADRSAGTRQFSDDQPFAQFTDPIPDVVVAAPEKALEWFKSLVPALSVDAESWAADQRERAFFVARSCDETLTAKIQDAIADAIEHAHGTAPRGAAAVDDILEAAGVGSDPAYAELVYRTASAQSYQHAQYAEMTAPDVAEHIGGWRYAAIPDGRARPRHAALHNHTFSAAVEFADVRGHDAADVIQCRCSLIPLTHDQIKAAGKVWDRVPTDAELGLR